MYTIHGGHWTLNLPGAQLALLWAFTALPPDALGRSAAHSGGSVFTLLFLWLYGLPFICLLYAIWSRPERLKHHLRVHWHPFPPAIPTLPFSLPGWGQEALLQQAGHARPAHPMCSTGFALLSS